MNRPLCPPHLLGYGQLYKIITALIPVRLRNNLDRTGCQWDALPADFPHHKLVYHYFKTWTSDGTLNRMHNTLREQVRVQVEHRNAQPSAAVVDSQPVRAAENVARRGRGYDAGKKTSDAAVVSSSAG